MKFNFKDKEKDKFQGINILDGLSGSGILGLRLWKEINLSNSNNNEKKNSANSLISNLVLCDSIKTFDNFVNRNLYINGIDPTKTPNIRGSIYHINIALNNDKY